MSINEVVTIIEEHDGYIETEIHNCNGISSGSIVSDDKRIFLHGDAFQIDDGKTDLLIEGISGYQIESEETELGEEICFRNAETEITLLLIA